MFTANDQPEQARECMRRRVPDGHVLAWLEVDVPEVACAGFVVVNVR